MSLVYRRSLGAGRRPATLLIAAAIAFAAVLLTFDAVTARAAFPGDPGPIVYPKVTVRPPSFLPPFRSRFGGLYAENPPSGPDLAQLTHSPEDHSPSFSRSGERIVFVRESGGSGGLTQIFIARDDGSELTPLTDGAHLDSNPSFFPGGGKVAFDRRGENGFTHVYAIHPDTGRLEQLTFGRHNDTDPVVSPKGGRIAFVSDDDRDSVRDHGDIWVMRTHRPYSPRVLIDGRRSTERAPDYAPGGRRIGFDSNRGRGRSNIFIAKANGRRVRRVTHSRYDCFFGPCYKDPAFSPNGRRIVMLGETRYSSEVVIVRRNGRRVRTVADGGTGSEGYGMTVKAAAWGRQPR